MMVTVLPSKLGSFLSASLLWGANRSVAICWAVSMAAPKVSRDVALVTRQGRSLSSAAQRLADVLAETLRG